MIDARLSARGIFILRANARAVLDEARDRIKNFAGQTATGLAQRIHEYRPVTHLDYVAQRGSIGTSTTHWTFTDHLGTPILPRSEETTGRAGARPVSLPSHYDFSVRDTPCSMDTP